MKSQIMKVAQIVLHLRIKTGLQIQVKVNFHLPLMYQGQGKTCYPQNLYFCMYINLKIYLTWSESPFSPRAFNKTSSALPQISLGLRAQGWVKIQSNNMSKLIWAYPENLVEIQLLVEVLVNRGGQGALGGFSGKLGWIGGGGKKFLPTS